MVFRLAGSDLFNKKAGEHDANSSNESSFISFSYTRPKLNSFCWYVIFENHLFFPIIKKYLSILLFMLMLQHFTVMEYGKMTLHHTMFISKYNLFGYMVQKSKHYFFQRRKLHICHFRIRQIFISVQNPFSMLHHHKHQEKINMIMTSLLF